jgi:hypothetical protein
MVKPIKWETPGVRFRVQIGADAETPDPGYSNLYIRDDGGNVRVFFILPGGSTFPLASGSGAAAPASATYIVQTADTDLPNAQDLAALTTGVLWNTTGTGVLSIAVPETDYVTPSGAGTLSNKTLDKPLLATGGTPPPAEGLFWADTNTNSARIHLGGITQSFIGTLFSQTADVTVGNTTTETSLLGTGIGSVTLPANFYKGGRHIRLKAGGYYSTNSTAPTLELRFMHDTTILVTTGTPYVLPASVTNGAWRLEVTATCRSTGVNGNVMPHGMFEYKENTDALYAMEMITTSAVTINTTVAQAIDLTAEWSAAETDNEIVCQYLTIEAV